MLFKGNKFGPSGVAEYLKLSSTLLAAAAQVGLNIALAVLIGTDFRSHAPWTFYLAIALACAWAIGLLVLITALVRLVRFLNKGREILQTSRSSLVLPLGAESLTVALGSALLSSAVVWISTDVKHNTGEPFGTLSLFFQFSATSLGEHYDKVFYKELAKLAKISFVRRRCSTSSDPSDNVQTFSMSSRLFRRSLISVLRHAKMK